MDIERELPKMCVRDEKHMRKHFGIFEDGKLVAGLGVYPYLAKVANISLSFSTLGNVVTCPEYEGRGYIFTFTGKNRLRKFPDFKDDIIFEKITARYVYALMSVMRIVRKPIKSRL